MHRLVPGLPAAWLLLTVLLVTVLLVTVPLPTLARPQALPGQAEPAGQGLAFGDSVIFGKCLKLTAVQVSDRDDPMHRYDWVTLSVSNGCPLPVRHLLVQLALYDAQGNAYGGPVWVLERGIVLPPGRQRMERFAVPDPGQLTAVRWDAQVLTVDAPRARRRR
jgi:hypothetical protein